MRHFHHFRAHELFGEVGQGVYFALGFDHFIIAVLGSGRSSRMPAADNAYAAANKRKDGQDIEHVRDLFGFFQEGFLRGDVGAGHGVGFSVVKVNTIFRNDQGNVVLLSLMKPAFPYRIREQQLWLSPDRCIYWEEEESLIVSDLHFGKTGHFRKEGIAVPQRVYREDLFRLLCQIQYFRPRRLLVVGDLFHSRENKELSLFLRWREDLADLDIHLIQGNHDILHDSWYEKAGIGLSKEFLSVGPFSFVHDIADVNVGEGVATRSVATRSVATRSVATRSVATRSVTAGGGAAASKAEASAAIISQVIFIPVSGSGVWEGSICSFLVIISGASMRCCRRLGDGREQCLLILPRRIMSSLSCRGSYPDTVRAGPRHPGRAPVVGDAVRRYFAVNSFSF